MERRSYTVTEFRVEKEEGKPVKIGGYAAIFNENSVVLNDGAGPFTERIEPGAFSSSLGADVRALFNHDPNLILGRTRAGTLRLSEDSRGLLFDLDLPDTTLGRDLAVSVERGDVREVSFAFKVPKGGEKWAKVGSEWMRTLTNVSLIDVSPATFAAYPATEVGLRAATADSADAVVGLKAAQEAAQATEASERAKIIAASEARKRRLRLHERGLPRPSMAEKRAAFERYLAEHPSEKREASLEDKLSAVWYALYDLLGSPWDSESGPWRIEETLTDRVIVETTPGKLFAYPITFAADNTVAIGAPTAVEAQYVPLAAGA